LNRRETALNPLVEEVMNDLKPETASRHIQWEVGELPLTECDPGLMKQVFANLIANAVKYTRPREDAKIEVGQIKDNGETAVFVRDNGVGFNMKYSSKLFGVFQRLHRSEEFEGTGVGLATVALALSELREEKQLSYRSYREVFDKNAQQIIARLQHPSGQLALLNPRLPGAALTPLRPLVLPFSAIDFDDKAKNICRLYLDATRFYEEGRLVLSSDEKTGMQILQRKYPTRPAKPGFIEKREFEYIRHGTRALLTTFCVPTGQVVWNLGKTRTSVDWVRHLDNVATQFSHLKRFDWIVDNLNTHWSLDVCRWVADRSGVSCNVEALETGQQRRAFLSEPSHKHVFHFTPIHGSWLNQVELFFSVLSRRFLKRGDFASAAEFEERLNRWLISYNRDHAHPYRWTYTGEPLVRDTPFSQTRRQLLRGRAWCGVGQNLWQRRLYPPRPYHRHNDQKLAKDL